MNHSEYYVENVLYDAEQDIPSESLCSNTENRSDFHENENSTMIEKSCAVWTYNTTTTLLKLYHNTLENLETPKKKTRIWRAISESLKDYNINMTADQVRWKINALTKKYKQCEDIGQPMKFKYYKEMDDIYAKYNVDSNTSVLGDCIDTEKVYTNIGANNLYLPIQVSGESKAMIELRKTRLANRIESARTQSKLNLEKQWLEYLNRQEQNKSLQDEIFDRYLEAKENDLELRKKQLEIKESMELQKLQLKEREHEDLLRVEKEKCEILKQFLDNKNII